MDERRKLELMEYHLAMVYELSEDMDLDIHTHNFFMKPIYSPLRGLVALCVTVIKNRLGVFV